MHADRRTGVDLEAEDPQRASLYREQPRNTYGSRCARQYDAHNPTAHVGTNHDLT